MAAVDDPKVFGRARLSFANVAEIDEFAATLAKFERGEITSDEWRLYRLVRGTYGQRQPEAVDERGLPASNALGHVCSPSRESLSGCKRIAANRRRA
jgi:hypothetical protein